MLDVPKVGFRLDAFLPALQALAQLVALAFEEPLLGSKSCKATSVSDRQTTHLNTMLVACESLWTSNTS